MGFDKVTALTKLELACKDAIDVLNDLGIEYGPIASVTINFRMRSTWGTCEKKGDRYYIEISSTLLEDDVKWESLLDTVIHEYLHAHKDRMCHTGEWKRCAQLVNREYPCYNIKRCTSSAEKGIERRFVDYKYLVTCDGCGSVSAYRKKGRVVKLLMAKPKNSGCHCLKCGSTSFTVIAQ